MPHFFRPTAGRPRRGPALLLLLALTLASCARAAERPAGAATINGRVVPLHQYTTLVAASQRRIAAAGIPVSWDSPEGAQRLTRLQEQAIRQLVRNAVVEQLAGERHITVSERDLDAALTRIEEGLGGPAALEQQLERNGLTRAEFRELFRPTLLEQRLRQADPDGHAAIEGAVQRARVQVFVGPCTTDHRYPRCLEKAQEAPDAGTAGN